MSPEFGGTERHLLDLIQLMSISDVELSIVCLGGDPYTERLAQFSTIHVNVRREANISSIHSWWRLLRESQPDVVVFVRSWLWCFPWYTCLIAWAAGIPRRFSILHLTPAPQIEAKGSVITHIVSRFIRLRKRFGIKRIALCCTSMICVSNAIRNSLVNDYGFPSEKALTIHNGVSLVRFQSTMGTRETFRRSNGVADEEFLLVCVARLTPRKRLDLLLNAVAKANGAGVHCKCVIVGDGPLKEELLQLSCDLRLTDAAIFAGFQQEVKVYLDAADAFALTSDCEGFPLSILEAMAAGLPCIVTDVGGNAEAVTNLVDGFVVPAGSSDAVANAIVHLATNRSERTRMSEMARRKVRETFDVNLKMAEVQAVILAD